MSPPPRNLTLRVLLLSLSTVSTASFRSARSAHRSARSDWLAASRRSAQSAPVGTVWAWSVPWARLARRLTRSARSAQSAQLQHGQQAQHDWRLAVVQHGWHGWPSVSTVKTNSQHGWLSVSTVSTACRRPARPITVCTSGSRFSTPSATDLCRVCPGCNIQICQQAKELHAAYFNLPDVGQWKEHGWSGFIKLWITQWLDLDPNPLGNLRSLESLGTLRKGHPYSAAS